MPLSTYTKSGALEKKHRPQDTSNRHVRHRLVSILHRYCKRGRWKRFAWLKVFIPYMHTASAEYRIHLKVNTHCNADSEVAMCTFAKENKQTTSVSASLHPCRVFVRADGLRLITRCAHPTDK